MLEHAFTGPPFTVGIEEELMILDPESLDLAQEIEPLLAAVPAEWAGQVKPELFSAVLEICTRPCAGVNEAGAELAELRSLVSRLAGERGLAIGAAGTHPFARWEEQVIVDRPRYRELISDLGYIARRELIFGTHVHVAIEGADRAVYVADGIRRYLPLLLALSTNSPFWRGHPTGMMSSRVPVFRQFPREGIPPHYGTWEIYSHRVEMMMRSGAIEDYTYLWWDVRPHPKLGTVETRVCDQQTSLAGTLALAALIASLARRLSVLHDAEEPLVEYPSELSTTTRCAPRCGGWRGNWSTSGPAITCRRPSWRSACWRRWPATPSNWAARTTWRPSGRSGARARARAVSWRRGSPTATCAGSSRASSSTPR